MKRTLLNNFIIDYADELATPEELEISKEGIYNKSSEHFILYVDSNYQSDSILKNIIELEPDEFIEFDSIIEGLDFNYLTIYAGITNCGYIDELVKIIKN